MTRAAAAFAGAQRRGGAPAPVFHSGHALVHRDPMRRAESAIHRALDEAMLQSQKRRSRELDRRERELDELIAGQRVRTLYQPILDLRSLDVLGHEVFSHAASDGSFSDAETLFGLAERSGRILEFERLCRGLALASASRHLPAGRKLFLNAHLPQPRLVVIGAVLTGSSDLQRRLVQARRGVAALAPLQGLLHRQRPLALAIDDAVAARAARRRHRLHKFIL